MMKSYLSTTALSLMLALSPAVAQDAPKDPETEVNGGADGDTQTGADTGADTEAADPAETPSPTSDAPANDAVDEPATGGDSATDGETADDTAAAEAPAEVEFISSQESGQWLAEDYIGTEVTNLEDESLGSVNNLLLEESGQVTGVVIGVGGFLGIGEKDIAVKFDAIEETVEEDGALQLTLDTSREELENAPDFESLADQSGDTAAPLDGGAGMEGGADGGMEGSGGNQ